MNILYIERCLSKNSIVFDQITRLSKYIEAYTVAVQVGCFPFLKAENVTNVRCSFFPKIEQVKSCLFNYAVLKKIDEVVDSQKIDLIHSHFAYPDGIAAYIISKKYDIPYILTVRGDDVLVYPQKSKYLLKCISKVVSNAKHIIGVSGLILNEAIKLGANPNNTVSQPDGIIPESFYFDKRIKENNQVQTVLYAGELVKIKNLFKLVDAFSIVAKQIQNVRFELAGSGYLCKKLEKYILNLNLEKKCGLIGYLDHKILAEKMRKADILCLPSISESWGNVITEAMACGTPVVGSNVGGIPEQIISDDYGYLCNPYSSEDIAEKILKSLNKKWNHQKIANRGKIYTRDNTAKKIAEVYRKVI